MSIAFGATTQSTNGGGNLTFSHTTSGTNRMLFVGAVGGVLGTGISNDITAISYNSVALTKINEKQINTGGTGRWVSLWYLIAPTTGANNVVVTSGSSDFTGGIAVSYTGALQSGVPDASVTNSGTNVTTMDFTVTTVADNCWGVLMVNSQGVAPSAGTNSTLRGSNVNPDAFDTNGSFGTAGVNKTMNITDSGSNFVAGCMATFAPDGLAPVVSNGNFLAFF